MWVTVHVRLPSELMLMSHLGDYVSELFQSLHDNKFTQMSYALSGQFC